MILFNAERYAKEWISAGHIRSYDPSKRRMKRPELPPNKKHAQKHLFQGTLNQTIAT